MHSKLFPFYKCKLIAKYIHFTQPRSQGSLSLEERVPGRSQGPLSSREREPWESSPLKTDDVTWAVPFSSSFLEGGPVAFMWFHPDS